MVKAVKMHLERTVYCKNKCKDKHDALFCINCVIRYTAFVLFER